MTPRAQLATGFFATVAILVPAGWHALGADIEKDGKHLRPMQEKVTIDGVEVTLDVDRSVVMTGDTVTATLVATSDSPKDVTVDLRALHTQNYSGERVELPWQQLDRETITLHAAPGGGKAVRTRIKLGERPDKLALEDSFKIMVAKHGLKPEVREFDTGKAPDYDAIGRNDDGTSTDAAGVFIRGWSGNNLGMTIAAKGPVTGDAPFTIAVTLKNTSGHKLPHAPWINLTTEDALTAADDQNTDPAVSIESADDDDDNGDESPMKKNASVTKLFTVTPNKKLTGTIAFLASASENDGPGSPSGPGAMDIKTFKLTESTPSVAVK